VYNFVYRCAEGNTIMTGLEDTHTLTATAPSLPTEPPTILIVDDEPAIRRFVRLLLTRNGYGVAEAASAAEALSLCEQPPGTIHLLLTDFRMPGLNGVELVARVMARHPQIKVLFMTGFAADLVSEAGFGVSFLAKPFTEQELIATIRQALRSRA
jgi:two-component system, cell cycle sensor histidine kinase and response regulator CckA